MGKRFAVLFIVLILSLGPLAQTGGSDTQAEDRGPGPMDASEVWTDPLDDTFHVFRTSNVEVTGGEVLLATGETEGWIASEVIPAKDGYKYDFVLLDATIPGNSSVEICILDATKAPTGIGYANETVPNFDKEEGVYRKTRDIEPNSYPEIRIQVNLNANGTDRPTLQAWSLYYVPRDEWRDEFLGDWKMTARGGLNFTGDSLEVNLTSKSSEGAGYYQSFPPLVMAGAKIAYPNNAHDDYQDPVQLSLGSTGPQWGVCVDDMNDDGYLDIIYACRDVSKIVWGDDTGIWSVNGATDLTTDNANDVAAGDFDGDGDKDLAFAEWAGSLRGIIFYNDGSGGFNSTHDESYQILGHYVDVGDINHDGFDDVLFGSGPQARVYLGGPGGPDTIPDGSYTGNSDDGQVLIDDLNKDGYLDILLGTAIFLGDENGVDTTREYYLTQHGGYVQYCGSGDINGDGYKEIIVYSGNTGDFRVQMFEGDANGWQNSRRHDAQGNRYTSHIAVADIDKDGYDDIVIDVILDNDPRRTRLFSGGPTFPTSSSKHWNWNGGKIEFAIPKGSSGGPRLFRGTFTTEPISLPSDQWKWDMIQLGGRTPQNTTMTITVLDSTNTPISGYENLPDWNVDLLDIDWSLHGTIKVKIDVTSDLNTTTPVLDRIFVKWMEKMTWRDQFFGDARSDRIMGVDVMDGFLRADPAAWSSPQILFTSVRNDTGFNWRSQAYMDAGDLDFLARPPMTFPTKGTAAFDMADVDHDGFTDIVFATHQTSDTNFAATSPLFYNSATGWRPQPDHTFPTTGAADVLLEDLDDDGYTDVVFAQEMEAQGDYTVNSTLFWGSADGWADTPDLEFVTTGAVDVEAFDHDGDGDLDLVFACYKSSTTDIDSMVFTQGPDGFNGSNPSLYLATRAARGVAAGDLNDDTYTDLVFANSFGDGFAEIDSYIYWGNSEGGFGSTPTGIPTVGAEDVAIADVNNDGHPDLVFANSIDNSLSRSVDSYVYLNDGSGGFSTLHTMPTTGAVAVAVGDLDGTGWKDLVFACQRNDTSYDTDSCVYQGGASGWSSSPDILLPTEGASDVAIAQLTRVGYGGYISKAIVPEDPRNVGTYHSLRYTTAIGSSQKGTIVIVDADTEEPIVSTQMTSGTHEWDLQGVWRFKEHPSIRVVIIGEGLDQPGSFEVDEVWLNWTKRVKAEPVVLGLDVSAPQIYRAKSVTLSFNVMDEYDLPGELRVWVEHTLNGTEDWESNLLGVSLPLDGDETVDFTPRVDTLVGSYDFKVVVQDTDGGYSTAVVFHNVVSVLNNIPTTPEVRFLQARPTTTMMLEVEVSTGSRDVETEGLSYIYRWYLDGVLQEDIVENFVSPSITQKGQNWSVEVSAWDGDDESLPGTAWRVIQNAGPAVQQPLVDIEFDEDTEDTEQVDLSDAFWDPDGDPITWTVNPTPDHLTVEIDPATGHVTITPEENWNGVENVTFVASDGELQDSQTITVTVLQVNDIPRFATVNGEAVGDGPIERSIKHGEMLSIDVVVVDIEGNDLMFETNSTMITADGSTGSIRWTPPDDMVGTVRFSLSVWDDVSPGEKATLDFVVEVVNENDPMSDPSITGPSEGASFEEEVEFSLIAICTDPDTQFGQILNFSWSSNMSGHLGYGPSLDISLTDVGTHVITLTVTDGEFEKRATVTVVITKKADVEPEPNGGDGDGDEPTNYGLYLAIVVVLVIIGVVFLVARTRKKTEEGEAADEEEYKLDHMKRAHAAVKEAADTLESGKEPTREEDLLPELEEIDVESAAPPQMTLSMEAKKTEAASKDTMALFADTGQTEPAMSEEEAEQLRVDNLKRKYQNAIGRLPYGIPSEELRDRDWVELAAALATGEKKMTPDGRETTEVDGRWYFSDPNDTGSFLKEHGAKPKPEKRKAKVTTDKAELLAKLEERFILGEISEETYNKLREKYEE